MSRQVEDSCALNWRFGMATTSMSHSRPWNRCAHGGSIARTFDPWKHSAATLWAGLGNHPRNVPEGHAVVECPRFASPTWTTAVGVLGSVPGRRSAVSGTAAVEVLLDLEELLGSALAAHTDEDVVVTIVGAAGSQLLADGALSGRFGHVEVIASTMPTG